MMFQPSHTGSQERAETQNTKVQITVGDVASRVWRARYWTLAGALLFGLLCVAVMPFVKPVYEASAQIYVDPQNLQLLRNDLTPSLAGGDSGVLIAESQVRIMQSATVLRLVVNALNLARDEEFGAGSRPRFSLTLGGSQQSTSDPVAQAVESLSKNINVVREDRTYMITIYARSRSAARAADIANAVVSAYLQVRDTQRMDLAKSASEGLESRLSSLQASLKDREDAVAKFKVDHNIVEANGNALAETRLSQNNAVVSTAEDAMNRSKVQRDQLQALLSHPERFLSSPVATASPDLLRLRSELEAAQADRATLEATLGQRHPRIITASTRIEAVQRAIGNEIKRLTQNAEIEYERTTSDYNAAVKSLDPLVTRVQSMDAARIQLRQLQRDADSGRAVYEETLTRSRETREQGAQNTLNAQVISTASAPIRRKSPPSLSVVLMLSVGLGAAIGLMLGVGYGIFREKAGSSERRDELWISDTGGTSPPAAPLSQVHPYTVARPQPLLNLAGRQTGRPGSGAPERRY